MSTSESAKKVAVIGAGLIGSSWAIVFARAGCEVALYDTVPGAAERARAMIAGQLNDLERNRLLSDAQAALACVSVAPDIAGALRGAHYAQESTLETVECKRAVFAEID